MQSLVAAFNSHRLFTNDLALTLKFPQLTVLSLRETDITDSGLAQILSGSPNLRTLDIVWTQVNGEGLSDVSDKCPYLESIDIYHPLDLSVALPFISKCEELHTLSGIECYDFSDEVFPLLSFFLMLY